MSTTTETQPDSTSYGPREAYSAEERKHIYYELYWGEMLTMREMEERTGWHRRTSQVEMEQMGVPRRPSGAGHASDWRVERIREYEAEQDAHEREYDVHNALAWLFPDCDGANPQRPYGTTEPWIYRTSFWYREHWAKERSTEELLDDPYITECHPSKMMKNLGVPRGAGQAADKGWEYPIGYDEGLDDDSLYTQDRHRGRRDWPV